MADDRGCSTGVDVACEVMQYSIPAAAERLRASAAGQQEAAKALAKSGRRTSSGMMSSVRPSEDVTERLKLLPAHASLPK